MPDLLGFHSKCLVSRIFLQRRSRGVDCFKLGKGQRAGVVGGKLTTEGKRNAFLSCFFCVLLLFATIVCGCARASCVLGLEPSERDTSDRKGFLDTELVWRVFTRRARAQCLRWHSGRYLLIMRHGRTLPDYCNIARAIYQR
ncbi:hypothetical protein CDEST_10467 [Colletotrichum destructivum]|uniref:Uncharacterized protein n=1 Tax=Colletotrichum destructivum TaxID=34406 RepID=A0AAX4IQJ9_9PEZI|nr:hypothetical protein CDEST_10467 [Colletotrichum destructivum]